VGASCKNNGGAGKDAASGVRSGLSQTEVSGETLLWLAKVTRENKNYVCLYVHTSQAGALGKNVFERHPTLGLAVAEQPPILADSFHTWLNRLEESNASVANESTANAKAHAGNAAQAMASHRPPIDPEHKQILNAAAVATGVSAGLIIGVLTGGLAGIAAAPVVSALLSISVNEVNPYSAMQTQAIFVQEKENERQEQANASRAAGEKQNAAILREVNA